MPTKKTQKDVFKKAATPKKVPERKTLAKEAPKKSVKAPAAAASPKKTSKPKVTAQQVQASASFNQAQTKAEQYAKDPKKLGKLFEEAAKKSTQTSRDPFGETWAYLQAMIRLIRAYATGEYRDITWQSLVIVVLAIVYFVSPIDAIPDWIPFVGFLDDALVISWAVKQVKDELDAFMAWEVSKR